MVPPHGPHHPISGQHQLPCAAAVPSDRSFGYRDVRMCRRCAHCPVPSSRGPAGGGGGHGAPCRLAFANESGVFDSSRACPRGGRAEGRGRCDVDMTGRHDRRRLRQWNGSGRGGLKRALTSRLSTRSSTALSMWASARRATPSTSRGGTAVRLPTPAVPGQQRKPQSLAHQQPCKRAQLWFCPFCPPAHSRPVCLRCTRRRGYSNSVWKSPTSPMEARSSH